MHPQRTLGLAAALLSLGAFACGGDAPPDAPADAAGEAAPVAESLPTPGAFLEVGTPAPDFALRGATRYGVLAEPVRLSDYRGKTVVLAFFFRVRGRG